MGVLVKNVHDRPILRFESSGASNLNEFCRLWKANSVGNLLHGRGHTLI